MLPAFDPLISLYEPIAVGLAWLAAVATAATIAVAGWVATATRRTPRQRVTVVPVDRSLRRAA